MHQPIPVEFSLNQPLCLSVSCGDCLHFKGVPSRHYGKACSTLGVIEETKPCQWFRADHGQLKMTSAQQRRILEDMASLTLRQLRLVAAVLNREAQTRKAGFRLHEIVYFHVQGSDFVQNYRKGYVVGADSKYVFVVSAVFQGQSFPATLLKSTVLRHSQWLAKKRKLLSAGKSIDPNHARLWGAAPDRKTPPAEYDPPVATERQLTKLAPAMPEPRKTRKFERADRDGMKVMTIKSRA